MNINKSAFLSLMVGFIVGFALISGCSSSGGGGVTTTPGGTGGGTGGDTAAEWSYDNATSGVTASTVQDALDEIEARLDIAEVPPTISKYFQSGVSLALNVHVTISHNLNTTTPFVNINITTAGDNFARTNYRVLNANQIEVWQTGSGTTFSGDVTVIAP